MTCSHDPFVIFGFNIKEIGYEKFIKALIDKYIYHEIKEEMEKLDTEAFNKTLEGYTHQQYCSDIDADVTHKEYLETMRESFEDDRQATPLEMMTDRFRVYCGEYTRFYEEGEIDKDDNEKMINGIIEKINENLPYLYVEVNNSRHKNNIYVTLDCLKSEKNEYDRSWEAESLLKIDIDDIKKRSYLFERKFGVKPHLIFGMGGCNCCS